VNRWNEKLKAARSEARIRQREFNAAQRALNRVLVDIAKLEKKIELARATTKA
jgi:ribosomal protein L16/L10AE